MNKIVIDPDVHFGKPCIAGTRITVQDVLALIAEGLAFEEIIRDCYPALEVADIQACVEYAIAIISLEDVYPQTVVR